MPKSRLVFTNRQACAIVVHALISDQRKQCGVMVGIAQLVERLVVVQEAAGSSPVTHPTNCRLIIWDSFQ